jgi:hypothetical protein
MINPHSHGDGINGDTVTERLDSMAIVKIESALNSNPLYFADPVINQLAALLDTYSRSAIIKDGYILKGSLFCIGGSMYITNSDTAISGTASPYVAITASGSSATAAYTTNINYAAWNGSYHNYYDASGVLYLFDESDAINDGFITTRYYVKNPTGDVNKLSSGNIVFANNFSTINYVGETYGEALSIFCPRAGVIKVSFDMWSANNYNTVYGQVYVDGIIEGTEQTSTSSTPATQTDTHINVSVGSIVSVYARAPYPGNSAGIKNLKLYSDLIL